MKGQNIRQYYSIPFWKIWLSDKQILSAVIEEESVLSISRLPSDDKRAIRSFLSSLRNPSDDEIVTLMSLPIFEAIDGTFTALQLGGTVTGIKLDVAPPRLTLPGMQLFFCLLVCLFVWLFVLSVCLSLFDCLFLLLCPSICLFVCCFCRLWN